MVMGFAAVLIVALPACKELSCQKAEKQAEPVVVEVVEAQPMHQEQAQ